MFTVSVVERRRFGCWLMGAILTLLFGGTNNLTAQQPAFTSTERWILQKVAAGERADLKSDFPTSAERVITSSFVRRLLTRNIPGLKVPANGVQIWNATVRGDLDLTNEEVPYNVLMQNCDFAGYVTFSFTKFRGSLSLAGSRFHNSVNFTYAKINEGFEANNTQFRAGSAELEDEFGELAGKVEFGNMKVEGPMFLADAIFDRPASFYGARIAGNFEANGVHFKQSATFELMDVRGHVFLSRSVFEGNARFFRVKVTENFEAMGAHFRDTTKVNNEIRATSFEGMSAYAALFTADRTKGATIFNPPVRFYGVNISTNLELDDAQFNGEANLENMLIKGHAFLRRTVFNGGASFWSTTVGQSFDVKNAQFNDARFSVNFSDLKADVLDFQATSITNQIDVSGLTFREIRPDGLHNFNDLIGRADYNAGAYSALEDYYRRHGNISEANNTYITRRRRERDNLSWGAWVGDLMYDGFVAYGRRPWQVIIPILIVLGCGWWMFRSRRGMQAQDEKNKYRRYSPLMYSLDLFLPIVDLRAANIWEPKESRRLARLYLTFHVIAGWALITIFVAAITGIVK